MQSLSVLVTTPSLLPSFRQALQEEQAACERSSNRTVYLNVVINARKRLIREHQAARSGGTAPVERLTVSHQAVLGGRLAAEGNFGLALGSARSIDLQVTETLAGDGFYDGLLRYCLSEEQSMENGYPIPVGKGEVDLPGAEEKFKRMLTKIGEPPALILCLPAVPCVFDRCEIKLTPN